MVMEFHPAYNPHITSIINYELYEKSKGRFQPLTGQSTHSIRQIQFLQALMLGQINDSITTLGKNYYHKIWLSCKNEAGDQVMINSLYPLFPSVS